MTVQPLEIWTSKSILGGSFYAYLYEPSTGKVLIEAKGDTREGAIDRCKWLKSYSRVARRRVVLRGAK